MAENSSSVRFLYGTAPGRGILKCIQALHLDRIAVWFLCSPLSRPVIPGYIRRNAIPMEEYRQARYGSFRDFFLREKKELSFDSQPSHLISPCDGWLSVYPIEEDRSFFLKGSHYRLEDLIEDREIAARFQGGQCLVFRLCAADYHHYCFIDDGSIEKSHAIAGQLHSVQPIACETYPVFTRNRRVWTSLQTDHFGPVVQTEIGALVVGGIVNRPLDRPFHRGEEKGRFELSGSTIVLLMQKDCITLRPEIEAAVKDGREARVQLGMWVATRKA